MASKKYLKDYELRPEVTAKGRLIPVAAYTGASYGFVSSPDDIRRYKRQYLLLAVLGTVCVGLLMWYTDLIDRERRYLILPVVFDGLAALGVCMGAGRLWTFHEPFTLKQRDKLANRIPAFCFGFMVLSAMSLACTVVQLVLHGLTVPTVLYSLAALVATVCGVLLFALRRHVRMQRLPDPPDQADENS